MNYMDQARMKKTETTSFGEYFDDQRDRVIKAMQNKNTELHKAWREDYDKRQAKKQELSILQKLRPVGPKEKKLLKEMIHENRTAERVGISDTEARLWQSHKFPEA